MPLLSRELHTSKEEFAIVITVYSIMYMFGQFLNGYLSDRHGPRLIVGIGLLLSVIANLLMGWMGTIGSFLFLMGLNGFGQSSGWSGLIKNLTPWFKKKERGVMMSYWTTCYVIGGMAATAFATWWLTNQNILTELSWRRAFLAPSAFLLLISLFYIVFIRNNPEDVGLESFVKSTDTPKGKRKEKAAQLAVLKNGAVWIAAAMYFFVKFTRYAFLLFIRSAALFRSTGWLYLNCLRGIRFFRHFSCRLCLRLPVPIAPFPNQFNHAVWLGLCALFATSSKSAGHHSNHYFNRIDWLFHLRTRFNHVGRGSHGYREKSWRSTSRRTHQWRWFCRAVALTICGGIYLRKIWVECAVSAICSRGAHCGFVADPEMELRKRKSGRN